MELELGAEVDQSLVTERLQGSVSYHGAQQLETQIQGFTLLNMKYLPNTPEGLGQRCRV